MNARKASSVGGLIEQIRHLLSKASEFFSPSTTEWSRTNVYGKVTLIDGTEASDCLWTRKVNGVRQYRKMTDAEYWDYMSDRNW